VRLHSWRVAAITLERAELDAVDAVLEVVRDMRERKGTVMAIDGDLDRRAVGDQRTDDGFLKSDFDDDTVLGHRLAPPRVVTPSGTTEPASGALTPDAGRVGEPLLL